MVLRELKDTINRITNNLLFKSEPDLSKDPRLTPKPVFEIFYNDRPGIKHPEITPSLPLLMYVHNNSPAIKVATMRLREGIFRRGFEWERKFESKCVDCKTEYTDIVHECEECGSKNIDVPNKNDLKRADKFFETCTIYESTKAGKRKLLHLLKQIEDDLNIYDDAWIIGVKEYWQDKEGKILLTTLHQILRGNPVTMRIVADQYGEPGGRWYTCLRHRDVVEEVADKKCPKCGRMLYEVHYVSVEGGGDSPKAYYIGDEIIHVSKYAPSALYGFSPIVTLWQHALTLTNMVEYVYRSYTEAHLPKGVLAMRTSNPDSAYEFWRDVDDKLNKDPHYIPKMFLEGEGQGGTGSGMEFVRFMDTLEEMQYIPVRDEIRRTIASIYGVTNIFIGDTGGVGGMNSEDTQIDITNMAAESGMAIYNDHITPELLKWLNILDWKYILQSPFEENIQRELNEDQTKTAIAQNMLNMGFNVELGEEDVFEFKYSGMAKKQDSFSGQHPAGAGMPGGADGGIPEGGFGKNPQETGQEGRFNESDIKMGLITKKEKLYVKHPNQAPDNTKVARDDKGYYYEYQKPIPQDVQIKAEEDKKKTEEAHQRQRLEALLSSATNHYENILTELKHAREINPVHAMSLENDLKEARTMVHGLHKHYLEMYGAEPKEEKVLDKEVNTGGITINIQKQLVADHKDEIEKHKVVEESLKKELELQKGLIEKQQKEKESELLDIKMELLTKLTEITK